MEQIELIEVNIKYADDIWQFRQEILECDAESEDQFAGCMSLDTSKSAEEWIKTCELRKSEETCNEVGTAVSSHMYIAVRKSDDKLLVTCDVNNKASEKTLLANGGVYENTIDVARSQMKRYWITV